MHGWLAKWRPWFLVLGTVAACDPQCAGGNEQQASGCDVNVGPFFPGCAARIDHAERQADGETYRIFGSANAGDLVSLHPDGCGGPVVDSTTADSGGGFEFLVVVPVGTRRTYNVSSRQPNTDPSADTCCGGAVLNNGMVVDNLAPAPPRGMTWRPETAWGCRQLVAGLAEPRATVSVFADPDCTVVVPACGTTAAVRVNHEGTWIHYTARSEPDPSLAFYARLTDTSGNVSTCAGPAELEPGFDGGGVPADAGLLDAGWDDAGPGDASVPDAAADAG
ncbi:MAG: hypothetical protein HY904_17660 [Deltaproteobacteria bacterium]|nr:hypothetical protein [Deltaproteobacteria bacterium]